MAAAELEALNYIAGEWHRSRSSESIDVFNPANAEVLARVPLASGDDVAAAVAAASAAFPGWRRTPPQNRIQYLFRFKQLLEQHADEIARLTTQENGKTFAESRVELQRGIENVEVACGIPTLMQGYNLEDAASGIDEIMIRQPLVVSHHTIQFSLHDSALVSAVRNRLWKHVYTETIRKSTAHGSPPRRTVARNRHSQRRCESRSGRESSG